MLGHVLRVFGLWATIFARSSVPQINPQSVRLCIGWLIADGGAGRMAELSLL
jgi:hypothetical protein